MLSSTTSSPARRGDVAEHVAVAYLLEKGFEVFHNASSVGPADLLAMDSTGSITMYDVKRAHVVGGIVYPSKHSSKPDVQEQLGVKLLFVFIGPEFQVVIKEDEKEFLSSVKGLGFAVKDLNKKRVATTSYRIKPPDGPPVDVVGISAASSYIGSGSQDFSHKFLKGEVINGFSFISKQKTTILVDRM